MTSPKLTAEEFIAEFNALGATALSRKHNINIRSVFMRRRYLERMGFRMEGPESQPARPLGQRYPWQINIEVKDGAVLVGSDAHYWPGPPSLMHRAFVRFCKDLKPKAVVLNGDVIDAPTISRHPPIGWQKMPKLADEIEAAKERLSEIERAAFKARKIWPIGNHDERFSTRIASVAPEYAKIHGVNLHDHFPNWECCWACEINEDVFITHKYRGGEHAPFNNTIRSGKTFISGHQHSAHVRPFTDLHGTRYGVDIGCLADTDHDAFVDYTRGGPKGWRSSFCVLTFKEGRLLQPELVLKHGDKAVQFRGEVIKP